MTNLFCIRPKGFNVGNDAIFLGLQHVLEQAFGHVVNLISLPATSRYDSYSKAGLTAKSIYEINQYGHGVIIGGGNLYENGELDVDVDALRALEVPLMLFSLSRGRVFNRNNELVDRTDTMSDRVIAALDTVASYSLSRDHATDAYLRSIGCAKSKVGGCPTIFLDRVTDRLPVLHEGDRDTAFISVRNPALMSIPLSRQAEVYTDVQSIIALLDAKGYRDIRLLCHDHRDLAFAASFADIDYVYTGDVYTYLALLKSCAINVSYRLHATLPCLAYGTPTIKISYDERALSLMETIGMANWNIDMIRGSNVLDEVENRLELLDELPSAIAAVHPHWQELYRTQVSVFRLFAADVAAFRAGARVRSGVVHA